MKLSFKNHEDPTKPSNIGQKDDFFRHFPAVGYLLRRRGAISRKPALSSLEGAIGQGINRTRSINPNR